MTDWQRMEAPLIGLDPAFAAFASRHHLSVRRNYQGWPERSLIQEGEVTRLIQVYLDDPVRLTLNVWLSASQDRGGARFWKTDYLMRGVPADTLAADPDVWLEQGYDEVRRWRPEDLSFAGMLAPLAPQYGGQLAVPPPRERIKPVKAPWSTREVWLGVAAVALILAVAYGLKYLLHALSITPNVDLWVSLTSNLLELLFLVPVWWFVVHRHHAPLKTLGFAKFKLWLLPAGLGFLLAYFVFIGFYATFLARFGLQVRSDPSPLVKQLSTPWPLFFSIAVVAPVVEETFFRGFLFNGLRSRYDWRWAAVISAAVFAGAHLELTFFIPAFLLGFAFAFLYQESNSVWPGIIGHSIINSLAVLALSLRL